MLGEGGSHNLVGLADTVSLGTEDASPLGLFNVSRPGSSTGCVPSTTCWSGGGIRPKNPTESLKIGVRE